MPPRKRTNATSKTYQASQDLPAAGFEAPIMPIFELQGGADSDPDEDEEMDEGEGGTTIGGKRKRQGGKGRKKIPIEFIQDKAKRGITFSKRKAGIFSKARELSTLTGTSLLLLVVSESGVVYTYTTDKFQPMVSADGPGKNLISACLRGTVKQDYPSGEATGNEVNEKRGGAILLRGAFTEEADPPPHFPPTPVASSSQRSSGSRSKSPSLPPLPSLSLADPDEERLEQSPRTMMAQHHQCEPREAPQDLETMDLECDPYCSSFNNPTPACDFNSGSSEETGFCSQNLLPLPISQPAPSHNSAPMQDNSVPQQHAKDISVPVPENPDMTHDDCTKHIRNALSQAEERATRSHSANGETILAQDEPPASVSEQVMGSYPDQIMHQSKPNPNFDIDAAREGMLSNTACMKKFEELLAMPGPVPYPETTAAESLRALGLGIGLPHQQSPVSAMRDDAKHLQSFAFTGNGLEHRREASPSSGSTGTHKVWANWKHNASTMFKRSR